MGLPADEKTLQAYARWAGAMYLVSMAVYIAQDAILAGFLVRGDFAATVGNAAEGERLYRVALALRVVGGLTLVGLGWTFYGLLKPVAPTLALITLIFRAVQAALDATGAALAYAGLRNYLAAAGNPAGGGHAMTRQLMYGTEGDIFQVQFVYLGVGSVLLFWLLLKSRFIPRPLALFGLVATGALIGQALAHLIFPVEVRSLGLGMLEYLPMFIAEIGTGLWLLVRGADTRWWTASRERPEIAA